MFVLYLFLTFIIVVALFPFNNVLNLLYCIILLGTSIHCISYLDWCTLMEYA